MKFARPQNLIVLVIYLACFWHEVGLYMRRVQIRMNIDSFITRTREHATAEGMGLCDAGGAHPRKHDCNGPPLYI